MKLTLPQQDVYFEQLLYPNDPIYNIGAKIRIEGTFDVVVFEKAYQCLIQQHDAYRTVFTIENEEVVPLVKDNFTEKLRVLDFSEKENSEEDANIFMEKEFRKPFDMVSRQFLHKFILLKVSTDIHYLFSVYHHIITDGWGTSLMFQRLVKNYNELLAHGKVISDYPYHYGDFVTDDLAYHTAEAYQHDKTYWLEKFKTLPEHLFQKKNPTLQEAKSERKAIYIKRKQYNKIDTLAKACKVSTFHFILGALFLYFGRTHQNNDFAIGLPVLNRGKSIFKKTVGLFMGISPLRMQMDFNTSFAEFLSTIRNQLWQDYRHQRFPLGKLAQALHSFHDKERLFNITLSYEKQNYADCFENTKTTVIPLTHGAERVALAMYIREFDENEAVKIDFDYHVNYFDSDSIAQVTTHFQLLLETILEDPHQHLFEYNFLSEEEKHTLLYTFNDTEVAYPKNTTLLDHFEEKALQYPNKLAVKDAHTSLSYKELQQQSDTIAQNLVQTAQASKFIGVLLARSVHTISVLLGILKAGKSYIPLDATFPHNRLQYIVDHSGLTTIISDQSYEETFKNCQLIPLYTILQPIAAERIDLPKVTAKDTAYIIYTSGSTGNPKGVEVGHKALLNFLRSMQHTLGIKQQDHLFAVTTYSFDISILEFFLPLISGASVYIASDDTLADYSKTIAAIAQETPTIIQATPSFYQLLITGGWKGDTSLKILCGGDLLSEDLASVLLPNSNELWNMYGPTETTIWSSVKKITTAKESGNIGKPIANTQFYILDTQLQLLPTGNIGTLYIGGEGLAKGYFKDSVKTAEKFIPNPFGKGLMYNTNDLASWNEKGELLFFGRNDNQVKIRGFRIELEDIETKLNEIPAIKKAIIVAKKQQGQEAFLVAYIQKQEASYDIQNVIPILEKELPLYMIPHVLQELDDFPLTLNKKIDRKQLSERSIQMVQKTDEFPTTSLQKQLASFWRSVLKYNHKITLTDNFFALGGHSLNAVKFSQLIYKEYNYAIGLKTIFEYPTIGSLSNYLQNSPKVNLIQISPASSKEYYVITPSQYQLWVASQTKAKSIAYNMVAAYIVKGKIDQSKLQRAVSKIIQNNEILRTNFIEKEGEVFQKIKSPTEIDFSISLIQVNPENVVFHVEEFINSPFNLAKDLMLKMALIHTSSEISTLVFCTHHIIMDGISLELFTKDLKRAILENEYDATPSIQFKDYAEWLLSNLNTEKSILFFQEYLKNYCVKESIPSDKITASPTNAGAHYTTQFPKEMKTALQMLAKQQEVSMYQLLVTLINSIIYVVSKHTDIVIGTVHSGRTIIDISELMGMFVKTLPLRTQFSEESSFEAVLTTIQQQFIRLDEYQEVPISIIKEDLFDMLITYQKPDFAYQDEVTIGEMSLTYVPTDTKYSRIPLLLNFFELNDFLNLTISYNTDMYEESSAIFIVELFKKIGMHVIENPSIQLIDLKEAMFNNTSKQIDFDFNF